ncbi:MAG: universal stress protein, partial [Roseibium sp.]|uniref:universal stress protein n=1 Tax=Roseibium sp. TaxID=1936156 RepID=UPI003298F731
MVAIRKSNEEGHRRKFLVVDDDTPECDRAIVYAAKRAARTGGVVTLLFVVAHGDYQHWLGVEY